MTDTPSEHDDDTIAVDRVLEDDHTIAVASRRASSADGAEITDDPDGPDDTLAITRPPFSPPPGEEGHDTTFALGRTGRGNRLARPEPRHRRRGIKPPPVPEGFAPLPVDGLGAWGVEEYPARTLTAPPAAVAVDADAPQVRGPDPAVRSVRRHARRSARRAFTAFVVSCVVLVVAIGAVLVWVV